MWRERIRSIERVDVLLLAISFGLLVLTVNNMGFLVNRKTAGFQLEMDKWRVLSVEPTCQLDPNCVRPDDFVEKMGNLSFEEMAIDRSIYLYRDLTDDAFSPVVYRRGGERRVFWVRLHHMRKGIAQIGMAMFPALFWFAGTLAVLFLRPRNRRWLVLVAFNYLTVVWAATGLLSGIRWAYASVIFHIAIWPFMAVLVHLHLIVPEASFPRLSRWLVYPLYFLSAVLAAIDHYFMLPIQVLQLTFFSAIVLSLCLLVARAFQKVSPQHQVANRLLLYGVSVGLLPVVFLGVVVTQLPSSNLYHAFSLLAGGLFMFILPAWPFSYLYALYRSRSLNVEFRANRLVATYGFFSIYVSLFVGIAISGISLIGSEHARTLFLLLLSLLFVVLAPLLRVRSQSFVDRYIYGIRHQPEDILSAFATRIPQALSRPVLRDVICEEILPAMLIRQSGLYVYEGELLNTIYEKGVPARGRPIEPDELSDLVRRVRPKVSIELSGEPIFPWVRLVIPLETQDLTIGWWLLGRRDPDDYYSRLEILVLTNLANQFAPMIENFRLLEMARAEVEENKRLQEQLVQSQKMEAIGRLSAGVAHDFNNLLSVILGYSSLLMAKYGADEQLSRYLGDIRDAGNRAAALTRQLLAFSRQQVMEAKVVDLNGVVEEVEKMLRRLTGEDVELVTRLAPGLPMVKIDPGQMSQVILNLAVNARDAMPEGGRLKLETCAVLVHEEMVDAHQARIAPGHYVQMTVSDTGSGIDPKVKARIFEPYFTTKEMGKGTGLGLSMVYGIIRQSRGAIQVDSEEGRGTTFRIFLPAAGDDTIAQAIVREEEGRARSEKPGTEKLLLVEDDDSVRSVAREILEANGYSVLEATNGQEALDIVRNLDGPLDLVLTDVIMPVMKGTELARRLAAERPGLKVVFMSGYNEESIFGQREAGEPNVLIQKPFAPQDLLRWVREVLDRP
jgi:signal transduction histidine kinase/CheY-like chemotaxis protein